MKIQLATAGTARLAEGGRLVLAESLPERAPRLHEAFDLGVLGAAERAAVVSAEEEHYRSAAPLTEDAVRAAPAPQFGAPDTEVVTQPGRLAVTRTLVERWFSASAADGSSYAALLLRAGAGGRRRRPARPVGTPPRHRPGLAGHHPVHHRHPPPRPRPVVV